jgi:hypothetical protein
MSDLAEPKYFETMRDLAGFFFNDVGPKSRGFRHLPNKVLTGVSK